MERTPEQIDAKVALKALKSANCKKHQPWLKTKGATTAEERKKSLKIYQTT